MAKQRAWEGTIHFPISIATYTHQRALKGSNKV